MKIATFSHKCARLEQRKVGGDVQASVIESPERNAREGEDFKSPPAMLTASATLIRAINAGKVCAYLNPLSSSMPFVPFDEFTSSFFNPFESKGDELFSLSSLP